jgi:hypothetical protein
MEAVERGSESDASMVLQAEEREAERRRIIGREADDELLLPLPPLLSVALTLRSPRGDTIADRGRELEEEEDEEEGAGSGSELDLWLLISGLEMEREAFCERAIRLLSFFSPFLSLPFLPLLPLPLSFSAFLLARLPLLLAGDGGDASSFDDDDLFLRSISLSRVTHHHNHRHNLTSSPFNQFFA